MTRDDFARQLNEASLHAGEIRDRIGSADTADIRNEVMELCAVVATIAVQLRNAVSSDPVIPQERKAGV